jgi:hypothetical protein
VDGARGGEGAGDAVKTWTGATYCDDCGRFAECVECPRCRMRMCPGCGHHEGRLTHDQRAALAEAVRKHYDCPGCRALEDR